jgi:hypothetical protein
VRWNRADSARARIEHYDLLISASDRLTAIGNDSKAESERAVPELRCAQEYAGGISKAESAKVPSITLLRQELEPHERVSPAFCSVGIAPKEQSFPRRALKLEVRQKVMGSVSHRVGELN